MRTLRLEYKSDSEYVTLIHPYSKRFQDYIRFGIKPISYRQWDAVKNTWKVHVSKIVPVIMAGQRFFETVDYRSLPTPLQILVVKAIKEGVWSETSSAAPREEIATDPYATLYLLPEAPWEVVQAAYKALASLHHPDHGGDGEVLKEINVAYGKIKGQKSAP